MAHEHGHDIDWAEMVGVAELQGEVLVDLLHEATAVLAELAGPGVRRVLDIGSGPGVGTCVLAERFPDAAIVAADGSPEMLANVTLRAGRLGLADRVETRHVELPDGLDTLPQADAVWASLVLHHVGDERAALRGLRRRLEPGGWLALAEFGDRERVLPEGDDLGRPGIWGRLHAARSAWLADMRAGLPGAVPSGDYVTMLEEAGFDVLVDRMVGVELEPPLDDRAREAALNHVRMLRRRAEGYADPADLEALDALAEELPQRDDALLGASRRLLVARAVSGGGSGRS